MSTESEVRNRVSLLCQSLWKSCQSWSFHEDEGEKVMEAAVEGLWRDNPDGADLVRLSAAFDRVLAGLRKAEGEVGKTIAKLEKLERLSPSLDALLLARRLHAQMSQEAAAKAELVREMSDASSREAAESVGSRWRLHTALSHNTFPLVQALATQS